jgi:predicted DNA-binding transcriptional regulator YafY
MNRRDQLLRLLRRRADWTTAGLALELGVSRRTVLRDLGGLREAGFDLATFSGPGGGVRLNPTSIMITSQLHASEVVALIVSVEIARAAKTVPFAAGAGQALAKIEQALPASRAGELRTLRERILAGEPSNDARPAAIDHTFVPRPADLVTGVCPDARPTTTPRASAHAELPAHHARFISQGHSHP